MPIDDIYWNPVEAGGSDDLLPDIRPSKHYVDPWDLENYAYIREQLDSVDLSSDPSSSEEFMEANSTSFYYVPGKPKRAPEIKTKVHNQMQYPRMESIMTEQGNYAAIDEVKIYDRQRPRSEIMYESGGRRYREKSLDDYGPSDFVEDPYGDELEKEKIYYEDKRERRHAVPHVRNPRKDRSLSFSYGDYENNEDTYASRQEIYNKLDDYPENEALYDDIRSMKRKPEHFGLTNYGHLKIDYSYSWNNLYKIISN